MRYFYLNTTLNQQTKMYGVYGKIKDEDCFSDSGILVLPVSSLQQNDTKVSVTGRYGLYHLDDLVVQSLRSVVSVGRPLLAKGVV